MKPHLEISGVTKFYDAFRAVDDVSFAASPGEIVALLGPSGCGKTTLLNVIAGFLKIDAGAISVDGRDLSRVPPHRRDMGMVFQNYALFPHMTVEKNVAFGLKMRGVSRKEIGQRTQEALEMVQLGHVGQRYPKELSGGQQQRVALARALVVRPSVLLLDEPLSNLDALLRKTMREEMRQILKKAGITTILVTHDQEEALVTADSIILMTAGRVEQMATPSELYERPRTVFCARFMDVTNLFEGRVVGKEAGFSVVDTPLGRLQAEGCLSEVGQAVTIAIRPENLSVAANDGENRVRGVIVRESYHGAVRRLDVEVGGCMIVAHVPVRRCVKGVGEELELSWPADRTRILPDEAGERSSAPSSPRAVAAE
ncbi:ABC transporter ATP-binding protein [Hansschlegelia sp.]|uniref:ABC transporter ATP-binding protein n=1 Tax=Hansschlegelia sp. TaxID=2041892 RepID=UPI002CD8B51E|nr:ABC transporter ATP-binding protein [Hansschlegelia sp.]HVI30144.1 ABC transporter ATP-binding protein [Hansschlegelia sp.]